MNNPVLDAAKEIEAISSEINSKNGDVKTPKENKHPDWMRKKRKKRQIAAFFNKISTKWGVFRSKWLNLDSFSVVLTNLLSVFTVAMMCSAMYFSVRHLYSGSNPWVIISGAILIICIGFINREIGNAQPNEKEVSQ